MGKRLLGDSAGQNTNSAANNSFTLTLDHLAQLVSSSGPTGVSSADYVRDCVQASEHARILLCSQTHLVVRLGPDRSGGVVLAYDLTLPPKPQEDWTAAPVLTGRTVCGRGVTGSRPMLASALACILNANLRNLKHPIYLALQGPGTHDPLP